MPRLMSQLWTEMLAHSGIKKNIAGLSIVCPIQEKSGLEGPKSSAQGILKFL